MGRWLAALKKHENVPETNRQNPQKSHVSIIGGFGGAASGNLANFSDDADALLGVLGVPVSGKSENSHPDPDACEGRSAILEYDAELSCAEADRMATVGGDATPKSDAELYADALKRHSPGSYGSIGVVLGWGMTRAANAETILREAGRIRYDQTGRGVFVDGPIPSQATGEKS